MKITTLLMLALLLLCAGARGDPAAPSSKRVAMIVANANYANPLDRLTGPLRDAETLRQTLSQLGFTLELRENVDLEGLNNARKDFQSQLLQAGPNALGLFYYAGHGGAPATGNDNYLIPVEVTSISTLDFQQQALSLGDLLKPLRINRPPGATVIVVIDACRTLEASTGRGAQGQSTPGGAAVVPQTAALSEPDSGFLVALSTSQGLPASDDGTYARTLAAKLSTPGLTVSQVFDEVRYSFQASTTNKQLPVAVSKLEKICLVSCDATLKSDHLNVLLEASRSFSRGEIGQSAALTALISEGRTFERSEFFQGLSFGKGAQLSKLKASGANFKAADVSGSDLSDADLSGARLQAATAKGSKFNNSLLDGAYLPIVDASGASFDKASLKRTAWLGADLRGASFRNADLRGASFRLADLRAADFSGAQLNDVSFNGADLRDSHFDGATFANTNLHGVLAKPDILTPTQRQASCATADGHGGIQLVMVVKDVGAYGRKFLDLDYGQPGIGWKVPDQSLPPCTKIDSQSLPDNYESRNDGTPLFSIRFPEDMLEQSDNKAELYARLHQRLFSSILERMRAAHEMGWSLYCPFAYDFSGDCKAMEAQGMKFE
ncbi:caspase family protein [Pseudomonas putida]|uniref:caspase family protein n=1 Tax=Pseudomonas putida TaxID=303 RepID=UPI0023655606|nr:caspase family protein [Pseudomonas putida]MDD2046189.1 pentapeptide repeat-containing protein [Pseudomonas putida]